VPQGTCSEGGSGVRGQLSEQQGHSTVMIVHERYIRASRSYGMQQPQATAHEFRRLGQANASPTRTGGRFNRGYSVGLSKRSCRASLARLKIGHGHASLRRFQAWCWNECAPRQKKGPRSTEHHAGHKAAQERKKNADFFSNQVFGCGGQTAAVWRIGAMQ
jgi:hypothetical protein